jgi:hypothetical protein
MISIATGGDKESYDLSSYVAKDSQGKRCTLLTKDMTRAGMQ